MAKGAATENKLGALHATLTAVYTRVLKSYEANLVELDKIKAGDHDLDDEVAAAMLVELGEPNPAMLTAVAKFLKDNDILYDTEELGKLSAQEERLARMRKARGDKVVSLAGLPVADNG
ncbi:terminase small subunit [Phage MedPE-SWcel-C56]|uniref:Uncharacterized protein n=1 Tax=Phage MedPE-SWcel-C56 TaxID=1871314 RepID=A0A1B1IY33_9CAUD|nr:terminase small subunit [Phage MedPE-SWcel-C56]ANS06240.1 hypothetical protein [Phage MedPE-SWcel-C56]